MRIVFMGTPAFAVPSLKILLKNGYEVVSVVTVPDRPGGRGLKVRHSAIKEYAASHSLPLLQPSDLRDPGFLSSIRSLNPDLLVVVAFRILPPELYGLARLGAFNLHASLLPKYRGAAPINRAIMQGETETGVTTFLLQETVDTGSILLQARVRIGRDETAGELHDKLAEVGAEIVLQTVRLLELGKAVPRAQDDSKATPAPKIRKEDCRIDWSLPSARLHDFVRGLSPAPGAWTTLNGRIVRIVRTSFGGGVTEDRGEPGTIVTSGENFMVRTGDGWIEVVELQMEGRKRLSAAEFLRGGRLTGNEVFG